MERKAFIDTRRLMKRHSTDDQVGGGGLFQKLRQLSGVDDPEPIRLNHGTELRKDPKVVGKKDWRDRQFDADKNGDPLDPL